MLIPTATYHFEFIAICGGEGGGEWLLNITLPAQFLTAPLPPPRVLESKCQYLSVCTNVNFHFNYKTE